MINFNTLKELDEYAAEQYPKFKDWYATPVEYTLETEWTVFNGYDFDAICDYLSNANIKYNHVFGINESKIFVYFVIEANKSNKLILESLIKSLKLRNK